MGESGITISPKFPLSNSFVVLSSEMEIEAVTREASKSAEARAEGDEPAVEPPLLDENALQKPLSGTMQNEEYSNVIKQLTENSKKKDQAQKTKTSRSAEPSPSSRITRS